jgi:branched-subunit amino acid transport protein
VSWWPVLALAGGAYAFKALGLLAFEARPPSEPAVGALRLLPPALLGALIVVQTLADGDALSIDARLAGVAVAGLVAATWRNAPFLVVLVVAAGVTAAVRALA